MAYRFQSQDLHNGAAGRGGGDFVEAIDDRPLSVRNHRTGIVLDHEVTGADEFHAGLFTKLLGENALAQPWVAEDHDWPIEQDDFVLAEDPLPVLVVLVDERSSDPDPH